MAINFFDGSKGFFDVAGPAWKTQGAINTDRGTTIPNDIIAAINKFNNQTLNPTLTATIQQLVNSVPAYQSGASGTMTTIQQYLQSLLIAVVNLDNPQPDSSLKTALIEFIRQMKAQGKTVKSSTVTISAAAGGSNSGNGVCVVTKKRGDGLVQENTIAETILGVAQTSSLTSNFQFLGQVPTSTELDQNWPLGSGCSKSVASLDANTASALVSNGGFETFTNANIPDGWIYSVGVPSTNFKQTTLAQQTITVTGTPTSGTYLISWQNPAGKVQTTAPLVYNATASQVQAALRLLAGLGSVTVSSSGTTPNFTHTIVFNGIGGNLNTITITNNTNGTITPASTVTGTAQVFAGSYALEFVGDGATLNTMQQQITNLSPSTAYAVSLWGICDAAIAAGVIVVDLVDGIGGSVIQDVQSVNNSLTFNASSLTTSWQHLSALQAAECAFRTPAVLPPLVYLRIRLTTALTNTKNMYLDNVALTPFTELYSGGPSAQIFAGSAPWAAGDTFTLTTTNDRAGVVREYSNRNFLLDAKELLFPTAASPNIPNVTT